MIPEIVPDSIKSLVTRNPKWIQTIGFTGHRDKQTHLESLNEIRLTFPYARWIHGGARTGFDRQVQEYINEYNIEHEIFYPDYTTYLGKVAPLQRNIQIIDSCDILIACYDTSRTTGGTFFTIAEAKRRGVFIILTHCVDWPTNPLSCV